MADAVCFHSKFDDYHYELLTRDEANLIELTFTLSNYTRLLDPLYAKVMLHSLYMAVVATGLCLLIGYPFAYIVAKMPVKIRPFMLFMVIVPFWTNSLIRTYGLKIVLGTQGIVNKSLMAIGLIEHQCASCTPKPL